MKRCQLSPLPALLAFLTLAPVVACRSKPSEPEPIWRKSEVVAASDRVLWKVTLLALERQGYPLAGGLDPSSLEVTTGWKMNLAPFSKEGFRRRAEVRMEPAGPGRWRIQARVKRQVNKSLAKPLDPQYADWEWVDEDVEAATILIQHIRARLAPDIELRNRPTDPVEAYLGDKEGDARR